MLYKQTLYQPSCIRFVRCVPPVFVTKDLSETSLASRVCKSDAALILSTPQAELVDHINSHSEEHEQTGATDPAVPFVGATVGSQ